MVCSIALNRCVYFGKPNDYKEKTVNSFDYRQNFKSKDNFIIIYNDYSGLVNVKIEINDSFAKELSSRILKPDETK